MRFNTEIKERLNREHANSLDLSAKLMEARKSLEASIKSTGELRVTCDTMQAVMKDSTRANCQLESDLFDCKRLLSAATSGASESESQLRNTIKERDIEITEVRILEGHICSWVGTIPSLA
jgi:chromosome segregation ATPase